MRRQTLLSLSRTFLAAVNGCTVRILCPVSPNCLKEKQLIHRPAGSAVGGWNRPVGQVLNDWDFGCGFGKRAVGRRGPSLGDPGLRTGKSLAYNVQMRRLGEAAMFTKAMDYTVLWGCSMVFDAAVFILKHIRPAGKHKGGHGYPDSSLR
jgi:hypothetical protein